MKKGALPKNIIDETVQKGKDKQPSISAAATKVNQEEAKEVASQATNAQTAAGNQEVRRSARLSAKNKAKEQAFNAVKQKHSGEEAGKAERIRMEAEKGFRGKAEKLAVEAVEVAKLKMPIITEKAEKGLKAQEEKKREAQKLAAQHKTDNDAKQKTKKEVDKKKTDRELKSKLQFVTPSKSGKVNVKKSQPKPPAPANKSTVSKTNVSAMVRKLEQSLEVKKDAPKNPASPVINKNVPAITKQFEQLKQKSKPSKDNVVIVSRRTPKKSATNKK